MTNNKFKKFRRGAVEKSSSNKLLESFQKLFAVPKANFGGIANALTLFMESDMFKAAEKEAAAIRAASY